MSVLILSEAEVRELLPMSECIEAMEDVLRALARGELHQPLRSMSRPADGEGLIGLMPAHRGGSNPVWSLKEIVITPDNSDARARSAPGRRAAPRRRDGQLRAIMNASPITEIRTAAVSAVATRALARPDARVVAILGGGVQARSHAEAMSAVLPDGRAPDVEAQRRRHPARRS